MSRSLPTGFATLTEAQKFSPIFLVYLDWPDGAVRFWNGYGDLSWDSQTWTGTGHLGTISTIGESKDGRANGVTLSLSGIPSEIVLNALAGDTQGAQGTIWLGALGSDGALESDPLQIFDGVIDICPIEDGGETSTISVQLEKELIDRRLNNRRTTHEDQQIDYPGDLFFEFVAGLADKEVTWGGVTQAGSGTAPGAVAPSSSGGGSAGPYVNPLD